MSTNEIKERLHQVIDEIEDSSLLIDINEYIEDVIREDETPFTDIQKLALDKAIQQGLKDFEEGRFYSLEEIKKKIPEWPSH